MQKKRRAPFQTPSKKFKGDSRYTGSNNEDDYSDFAINKGFVQYSTLSNSVLEKQSTDEEF